MSRFKDDLSNDELDDLLLNPDEQGLLFPRNNNMGLLSADNLRKYFFWFAQIIGILIIVLTLVNIINYRGGFGGRDYPKLEFNWHILCMTLGFSYFSSNALITFRLFPLLSKPKLKLIHLFLNACVIICAGCGLFFVIDERVTQGSDHFISIHSWMGIAAITLMVIQFICGAVVYLSTKVSMTLKECLMPWHIKIGLAIFLLGTAAILTGMKKGSTQPERLLINFTGGLVVILCFLVLHIASQQNYKFSFRIK